MKNIKYFGFIVLILLVCVNGANAESKVIRKVIKKVITPQITPVAAPKVAPSEEVSPEIPPPPVPETGIAVPKENKGLWGWGLNTDCGGNILFGSIMLGARGDIVFEDPWKLGEKMGLADDAVEYKLGLGYVFSDKLNSVPLYADMVLYLKEGSLFGIDPYLGAGLIYSVVGSGSGGGLGAQAYLGVLANLGFASRTGIAVGVANYVVGNGPTDGGVFFSISQPVKL